MRAAPFFIAAWVLTLAGVSGSPASAEPSFVASPEYRIVTYPAHGTFADGAPLHVYVKRGPEPARGVLVRFSARTGRATSEPIGTATTDGNGVATYQFKPPGSLSPGTTTVYATVGEQPPITRPIAVTLDPATLAMQYQGQKSAKAHGKLFLAAQVSDGNTYPPGKVVFSFDGQPVGTVALAGGMAKYAYPLPADAAQGMHSVDVRYVGLQRYDPASTTLHAKVTIVAATLSMDVGGGSEEVGLKHRLGATLTAAKVPVPGRLVTFTLAGAGSCSAKSDAFGVASCVVNGASALPAGDYHITASTPPAGGDAGISDTGTFTVTPPRPVKFNGAALAKTLQALDVQLFFNSYAPGPNGWHAANGSSISIAQVDSPTHARSTTVFDIPEYAYGPFYYYINKLQTSNYSAGIENRRIKLAMTLTSPGSAIVGRCMGGYVKCPFGDDSTAPDVEVNNATVTVWLTPVAYAGSISYGAVDSSFHADFQIDGVCRVADVCEAIKEYKKRINAMINGAMRKQLNSDTVRTIVANALRPLVTTASRGAVQKAYINTDGDLVVIAPVIPTP